jgi:signal transduction histidine kinase
MIRNKDRSVKEIVCVTRDISKRKREEEMLQGINEELKKEKMNADRQKAAAIEANRYKSQFLANMSHELRTPLNSIIGFNSRVIKKSGNTLPPVQKEYLSIVQEEAQHLLVLINSLLDYSKIEAGKMDVHVEEFNLVQVIDEVYTMTVTLQDGKNIKYEQEIYTGEEIPILSDRIKVKQILVNLLSNAYKYSEKGMIKLSVEKEGEAYLIKIKDEGIGISAENIESIFDEFHQVDGSYTRKVGGTGLGLSITSKFVEMLGGRISAESVLGEGSVFIMRIPVRFEPENDYSL